MCFNKIITIILFSSLTFYCLFVWEPRAKFVHDILLLIQFTHLSLFRLLVVLILNNYIFLKFYFLSYLILVNIVGFDLLFARLSEVVVLKVTLSDITICISDSSKSMIPSFLPLTDVSVNKCLWEVLFPINSDPASKAI